MFFLLSTAEVVLANRVSPALYNMVMHPVRASRILFRPRPVSMDELETADASFKSFCREYCTHVYGGVEARLPLCRSPVAAVLDIASNVRSCGPIWTSWQFVMERFIGTLPKLVGSR